MLSAKQDALFGAGFARHGELDASILVIRPSQGGVAFATAWRDALLCEHERLRRLGRASSSSDGWARRSATLLRDLLQPRNHDGRALAPLDELSIVGVRQPSRLYSALAGRAVVGVLPLSLFIHGHSYWVQQRAARTFQLAPFSVRPQLAPLRIASHDTNLARVLRMRLQHAGLWEHRRSTSGLTSGLTGGGEGGRSSSASLLRLEFAPPPPIETLASALSGRGDDAGIAALAAHGYALAAQLQAVRYAAAVATSLGRQLRLPTLACYCDRDPSASLPEVLRNGCRLPSAESEAYLPFPCVPDQFLDVARWHEALQRDAGFVLQPATPPRREHRPWSDQPHPQRATDSADEPMLPVRAVPAVEFAQTISTRYASLGASPSVLALSWPPIGSGEAQRMRMMMQGEASTGLATALDGLLSGGPPDGWCVSCTQALIPPQLLAMGTVVRADGSRRFCFNFTRLVDAPFH